jgi:hypothetical protein
MAACERLAGGAVMPGLFVLDDRFPVGKAIEEILLLDACSEQVGWGSRVVRLPL